MKKTFIKIIAFTIIFSLCLANSAPALAEGVVEHTDILQIYNDDMYQKIFIGNTNSIMNTGEPSVTSEPSVTYSYSMQETGNGVYSTNLDLSILGTDMSVSGLVSGTSFNGDIYYEGKLTGDVSINGISYYVTAGLQKKGSSDDIKVGLVITDSLTSSERLFMSFGSNVITYGELCQLAASWQEPMELQNNNENNTNVEPMSADDDYVRVSSRDITLSSTIAGEEEYWFAYDSLRGALLIQSDSSSIKDYMESVLTVASSCDVCVTSLKYNMWRTSGNGYLAGFDELPINIGGSSTSITSTVLNAIVDVVTYIINLKYSAADDIPWFLLNWLSGGYEDLEGTITSHQAGSRYEVLYDIPYQLNYNVDDGYLPVTYQFDAGTGGSTIYRYNTLIGYRVVANTSLGETAVFYHEAESNDIGFAFD